MVRKRKMPLLLIIMVITLIMGGGYYIAKNNLIFNNVNHEELDTEHVYIADVYSKLSIRRDAFVDAEVLAVIDGGAELQIIGVGKGPMIEIMTNDNIHGFVQSKYIIQKGVRPLRFGKSSLDLSNKGIYYIRRASSIEMSSFKTEDLKNSVVIDYLIRGTPIQILETSGHLMQVISCESGIIGYIENDMSLLSNSVDLGVAERNTPNGKRLANKITDDNNYEYPVNSAEDVFLYQSASNNSDIIKRLGPGSWVTIEDDRIINGYVKIKEAYGNRVGYIDASYLYYG